MKSKLPKLLLVDDERNMRESLKVVLESHGYQADMVESAEEGLESLSNNNYFMVITDARLDGMSGYAFLQESHERWPDMPILMITAYATPKLAVEAIQSGAVDYLSKPFEPEELFLRIQKLMNLFSDINERSEIINFGDFTYNINDLQLKRKNNIIYLTEGENKLLIKLTNKKNEIVLREELAEQDYDESELRKVDVQVTRLRQKIEKNPKQPHFLKTIRGKGYKLICNEL